MKIISYFLDIMKKVSKSVDYFLFTKQAQKFLPLFKVIEFSVKELTYQNKINKSQSLVKISNSALYSMYRVM